jgi:hypothetical protein
MPDNNSSSVEQVTAVEVPRVYMQVSAWLDGVRADVDSTRVITVNFDGILGWCTHAFHQPFQVLGYGCTFVQSHQLAFAGAVADYGLIHAFPQYRIPSQFDHEAR